MDVRESHCNVCGNRTVCKIFFLREHGSFSICMLCILKTASEVAKVTTIYT